MHKIALQRELDGKYDVWYNCPKGLKTHEVAGAAVAGSGAACVLKSKKPLVNRMKE